MKDVYERLANYLDRLPAGFPRSESGIELKLLRKLFSETEAELAQHLTLLNEEARVVAFRAGLPVDQVTNRLEEMAAKGLISGSKLDGKKATYAASQFVVGFWEDQVNHLDREVAELFEEYAPIYFEHGPWKTLPQLRTIPVGETIPVTSTVMPYERISDILGANSVFAVRNCVCRQERQLLGEGCSRPMETCLAFGNAALNTAESGKGRLITREETVELIAAAERSGLVLQPANSQNPAFLCMCCGDCCGVLRNIKNHPAPSTLVMNPYTAAHDSELCIDCGDCLERCPMEALTQPDWETLFNSERCIGCGLCVSTCPTGAMTLVRRSSADQMTIPKTTADTYIQMGLKRKKMSIGSLGSMVVKSGLDRVLAPRNK